MDIIITENRFEDAWFPIEREEGRLEFECQ